MPTIVDVWTRNAKDLLVGKTIINVRYTSPEDNEELGWHESGLILTFNDNSEALLQRDDEGNGPGALYVAWVDNEGNDQLKLIPTI